MFALYGAITGFYVALTAEVPPFLADVKWVKIVAIVLSSINLIAVIGVVLLSAVLWKKIHPGYKWRNIIGIE